MGLILQIYKKSLYTIHFSLKNAEKTICIYATSAAVQVFDWQRLMIIFQKSGNEPHYCLVTKSLG